ncbi:MAG: AAA family ATPase [Deltaproteobacteria bacterium]|nr:AAA family ATPase [Deltaproteobacteria bacterium]
MQCVKCGAGNRAQAKFCGECGTALAIACRQCGSAVLVGKKFCGDCGSPVAATPITSAQVSAAGESSRHPSSSSLASPSLDRYIPSHLASRIRSGKAALEGERKIITVLFADIKGSMDILESLDPEESKRLLDPCLQRMMDAVHRAEGTVSRVLGDGIMALFGAPLALEDHPHRALYAALRMQETVRHYAVELRKQRDIDLQIRVGVNTGEVVVGAIGNDLFMEYTPVGHAVGLAARMETMAPPGSTLVTDATYRLTRQAFRFASRGLTKVKGAAEPFAVHELLGLGPSQSRLKTRTASGLSPFLGRARELAQMQDFAATAAAGHGQVVTLLGEAGLGKSRLIEECKPILREQGFLLIEGEGFAYGKTRAYAPLIDMLKRYCGIAEQDPVASYREKLHQTLTEVHASMAAFVPLFLDLLGVDPEDPALAALSGEAKLQQILNGIKRLIAFQCRLQPVAFLVEDVHWLDEHSLGFLRTLATSLETLPVLILSSSRPGYGTPWEEQAYVHLVGLEPLSPEVTTSLFAALVGDAPPGASMVPAVCQRSGGNPLFLEEMIHTLRETGALSAALNDTPARQLSPMLSPEWTLPTTIQGVLASRLDRLPQSAKDLLQTAAVIGQDVSHTLLAQVADLGEADFLQALHLLQARDLLHESALYPDSIYSFKHALTQEVAYHGLLQESRTRLHERVGNAMETLHADKLPEYASLLAYHYLRSANVAKAMHYLQLAGRRAASLYADEDAGYFCEEYLRLLFTQPHNSERDLAEVRARLRLISVLGRQHHDDTPIRAQFVLAEEVCHRLANAALLAELHATLAVAYILWGRPQAGLPHARAAKDIATSANDIYLQAITAGPLAHLLWLAGAFTEALAVAEEGLAHVQKHQLTQQPMGFIIHPYDHCLAIAGASRGFLGKADRGVSALRLAAEQTQGHGNRMSQAVVHWGLALVFDLYGEHPPARQEIALAVEIMEEVSPTTGRLLVGCLQEYLAEIAARGDKDNQPTSPRTALTRTWREQLSFCELAGAWLAEIEAQHGSAEVAQQLARDAVIKAEESGSLWFRCVAHLTLGRLLAWGVPETAPGAEEHLRAAYDLADQMHSLPFLAQTASALGSFLAGSSDEATKTQAELYLRQSKELSTQLALPALHERAHRW